MNIKKRIAVAAIILTMPAMASQYVVTGQIDGNVCWGFSLIKSCKLHKIDAIKGEDGKLYPMNSSYSAVSEYNGTTKRCWIQVKAMTGNGMGSDAISVITNAVSSRPEFFEKVEGRFEKIDVEYVTFPCVKQ